MNKDQVKGATKDVAGKLQSETGKMIGNKEMQAKGMKNEIAGKAQKHLGDAKEAVKDAVKR
jgi:uncharacterized protein YjbJ (UPF0337 family)